MSSTPETLDALRDKIIAHPDFILEDQELMHALIAANERAMGANIVDLRGIAMKRLEARLDRLEETHRSVIAAAYENLAGTNQIHRAILRMLDPADFENFLKDLGTEVANILRVDYVKLVIESMQDEEDTTISKLGDVLVTAKPGFVAEYTQTGTSPSGRVVVLRQIEQGSAKVFADDASFVRSEACLQLEFGRGRLPGLLVMGAKDPQQFTPQQGTDLLAFFGGVFERAMRRWLS
ncbi:hypothetical protein ROA7450_01481 [Roseovarius albus]|uniref:Recombinase XerC n=1 Tax=Roseovarius albus TaxID=1247867 RepID=A0A1X6YV78_9RHOB|nr:DUF484 family protein [Roseovarius albus]SLN32458.1 hypothetical protein ROA7450_01481 [Roseovarius albus]